MQWRSDSYFYFLLTEAILRTGHLEAPPDMVHVSNRLDHGALNIFAAITGDIIGVTGQSLRLYVPIVFSLGFFIGLWLLLKPLVSPEYALIGGYLFSMIDSSIRFTVQFHQFGFALLMVIFTIATAFFLNINIRRRSLLVLPLLIITGLSHVMVPSLFVVLISGGAIGWLLFSFWRNWDNQAVPMYAKISSISLLLIPVVIAIIYTQESIFLLFFTKAGLLGSQAVAGATQTAEGAPQTFDQGRTIVDSFSLITKMILVILAAPALIDILRGRRKVKHLLVALFSGVLLLLLGIGLISTGSTGRIITFGYMFAVSLAILTLDKGFDEQMPNVDLSKVTKKAAHAFFIICLVLMNITNGVAPSLVDESVDINQDGFHNVEPVGERGPAAGMWLRSYNPDRFVNTYEELWPITFYYGKVARSHYFSSHSYQQPPNATLLLQKSREYKPSLYSNKLYTSKQLYIKSG